MLAVLFLSAGAASTVDTGSSSFAVFTLGMRLGDAATLRVVGVVTFLLDAVPSAHVATRIGRRQTVALGLLTVTLAYGATAAWVATPGAYALVVGVAGLGGALVLVNILPCVFDLDDAATFGTSTGLAAVPVQAAAVVGPTVAGLLVDVTGSQRTLFVVAAVAVGMAGSCCSGAMVRRGHTRRRAAHARQTPEGWRASGAHRIEAWTPDPGVRTPGRTPCLVSDRTHGRVRQAGMGRHRRWRAHLQRAAGCRHQGMWGRSTRHAAPAVVHGLRLCGGTRGHCSGHRPSPHRHS